MSTDGAGIIIIILGALSLILQLFIDPNRPEMPDRRTPGQQKNLVIMAGVVGIMVGTMLVILSK